ncbi:MAG: hypothetical protein PHO07_21425, partial [Pirellulales bacterium]|nr:hypothetical protein [Pirellulales bacterium]
LAKSCLDGEALGELAAAREELQAKREERFELHNQRQRKQKALADVRDALASFKPIHEADRELWQREAAGLEAELAELGKTESDLGKEIVRLEAAETAAAERLLVP